MTGDGDDRSTLRSAARRPPARRPGGSTRAWLWTTSIVGLVALVTGFTTPPRSGPFCRTGCLGYPYTDAVAFVPRDYWWLYPQSLLVVLVLVLLVRIHAVAAPGAGFQRHRRGPGHGRRRGPADRLRDPVGGAAAQPVARRNRRAVSDLAVQPAWRVHRPGGSRLSAPRARAADRRRNVHSAVAAGTRPAVAVPGRWGAHRRGLPALAITYGADLEYRYEVAAIAVTWITFIVGGLLLFRWFGNTGPAAAYGGPRSRRGAAPAALTRDRQHPGTHRFRRRHR